MAEPVQQPATPTRGTSILEQLGLTAEGVLAPQNISSTLTSPTTTSDVLGIFEAQETAAGVPQLREQFQETQRQFLEAQGLAKQQQLTIRGRRKKLGVVRGEAALAGEQAQLDLQTLQQAQSLAQSALTSAEGRAAQRAGILQQEFQTKLQLQLENPGLDIDPLKDSFEDVLKELGKFQEKSRYKDLLEAHGKDTKGSRGVLRKRYKKLLKKLDKSEREAAEKAERRADEEFDLKKRNIESQIDNRGKTKGLSASQLRSEQNSVLENAAFMLPRGDDDFANPSDVRDLLGEWNGAGRSTFEFFEMLKDPITGETIFNPDDF